MIIKSNSAHRLIRLVWVSVFAVSCVFSFTQFSRQLLCLSDIFCENEWKHSLETSIWKMGSQGTASRLQRIARQVRALLTHTHQGAVEVDLLQSTAADLQSQLSRGSITSVDLVLYYLDQIERHNLKGLKLHALISVTEKERLLSRARELDEERQKTKVPLGPLHGIPIVVKVSIPEFSL
jgi:hypothetical protein